MSPSLKPLEWGKKFLLEQSKDPANMLFVTATIAWITSAAAQILVIIGDKEISRKEKEFLLPQEIADAAINIASFMIVTHSLQTITKNLVSKGRVITPKIREFCKKYNISLARDEYGDLPNLGKAIDDKIDSYNATLKIHEEGDLPTLSEDKQQLLKGKIEDLTTFRDEKYSPFESGFKVLGNIVGGVLSTNIITPMIRNPIAAWKQKGTLERDELAHDAAMYRAGNTTPVKSNLKIESYKSKFLPTSSGSMKI